MSRARYVRWQDGEMLLRYCEQFPDYLTQGASLDELEANLRDLYRDLKGGEICRIRLLGRVADTTGARILRPQRSTS